jgi:RimJ/RimL family protein N-acetyltransferase
VSSAVGTGVNTEAKLLMLTHAFESWQVVCVCFHADLRNTRSQAALERIGARREGVLRVHRLAVDLTPRDLLRFSIVATKWPETKAHLQARLQRKADG